MLDLNWEAWTKDGTIDPAQYAIVDKTRRFDHCVFTARPGIKPAAEAAWLEALFSMSYDNPDHREMMDLEGLKAMVAAGATRIGASAGVRIVQESRGQTPAAAGKGY